MKQKKSLGIIGLGAFGQLLVEHLPDHYDLYASDPSPEVQAFAKAHHVIMCSNEEVASCDVVVLAVPVPLMEGVLVQIKDHVKAGSCFLDVGSVKIKPSELMLKHLPDTVDIIATHPLFGPVGASNGLDGLTIVVCPLRGPTLDERMERLKAIFVNNFGLDVVSSTPEKHDKEMAYVQGLPHMIAKVLIDMEPLPRKMITPNYKHFLRSIDVVRRDTDDLFKAIFKENPFAKEVRDEFMAKAEALRLKVDQDL